MKLHALLLLLHLLAVTVWVGGMFFAHLCLRPAATESFEPTQRLPFLLRVYARFFRWVTVAVALVLLSGFAMLHRSLPGAVPPAWHTMMALGLVMAAIFASILIGPYRAMGRALATNDIPAAAEAQGRIRRRVLTNLILGLLTIVVATLGLAF
ncbi:CopD family protein [Denitratisoma sp. agr-D3]